MASIADDLALLLLDPAIGRPIVNSTTLDRALAGALLLDLAVAGRITADGSGARALLEVTTGRDARDPLLADAVERLGDRPLRARHAVERLARHARGPVFDRLVARRVLEKTRGRLLGVVPLTLWKVPDPAPVDRMRRRLGAVLGDGATPTRHEACLIALLHAVKMEHRWVDAPRKQVRARAAAIADGEWTGAAVDAAVRSVQASVGAAVAVAAAVGSSGAS